MVPLSIKSPISCFLIAALLLPAITSSQPSNNSGSNDVMGTEEANPAHKYYIDLPYVKNPHGQQKLDLYLPKNGEGPWPLIIWIHGGGWFAGSKDYCLPKLTGFLERGFAIASIDYRLTDVAPFPAQIHDVKAATRWLRASAERYNLDPERFAAWGDSAGGHLAALLGTSHGEASFEVGDHLEISSAVQAVCNYYGPTELISFAQTPGYESHAHPKSPESRLIGAPVLERPDLAAKLSPLTYIDSEDPPFFIVHGTQDPTVPLNQSEQLAVKLEAAGVTFEFRVIEDGKHGGPQFKDPALIEEVYQFFMQALDIEP